MNFLKAIYARRIWPWNLTIYNDVASYADHRELGKLEHVRFIMSKHCVCVSENWVFMSLYSKCGLVQQNKRAIFILTPKTEGFAIYFTLYTVGFKL